MGLPEIYAKYFGAKEAAEKKAEGKETAQAAAEAAAAEAQTISDEDLEKALASMSEDELKALATEVAGEVKASMAKEQEEAEKVAAEYYAAGQIFARGFLSEVTKEASAPKTATEKFADLLDAELKKDQK